MANRQVFDEEMFTACLLANGPPTRDCRTVIHQFTHVWEVDPQYRTKIHSWYLNIIPRPPVGTSYDFMSRFLFWWRNQNWEMGND